MEEQLKQFVGKKIDVNCGSNVVYRGEVISSGDGLLRLKNEEGRDVYVAIEKIAAIAESHDFASRPGFIV